MEVPKPLIEGHRIDPFSHNHSSESLDAGSEHGSQRRGLFRGQLAERLAVSPALDDELAWVGPGAGMMADVPQTVLIDDATRCRNLPFDLGAGPTPLRGGQNVPSRSTPL